MNLKMDKNAKIIILSIFSNTLLFITVLLSIQNSNATRRIKVLNLETIPLPISFIVTSSFIIGSFTGCLLTLQIGKKRD
tara:strand:+ start:12434 stop:12670 length:237 start_codon:yes stop_codon:yes gene_type:complete